MQLISAEQMQQADRRAIKELGIPGAVLMENAGRAATEELSREFSGLFPGPVTILAGKGNNGGDGYVVARCLMERGWRVETLVLARRADISGDADVMLQILERMNGVIRYLSGAVELEAALTAAGSALLIDALLGTGLTSNVRGLYAEAIGLLNRSNCPVVAIDIPSGVDGTSGRVLGTAVQAALTVTFDRAKIGHATWPGGGCVGRLKVVEIGIPARCHLDEDPDCRLIESQEATALLPERPVAGHKGHFGHLLLVAGSTGKSGAAALAGDAAVRSGCGLVTVACPSSVHDILEVKLTEAMTVPLESNEGCLADSCWPAVQELLAERQALAVGPGLGQTEQVGRLVRRLFVESERPLVADADALNALEGHAEVLFDRKGGDTVLTPHPGEMARMTGRSVAEIEADRFRVAREFAEEFGVVLVLKGIRTVIAAPDGRVAINGSGHVGLASGGSGDVLTGVIGGLLAQGLDGYAAACLGCYLHGAAADRLLGTLGDSGLKAGDLLGQLPLVRKLLRDGGEDA